MKYAKLGSISRGTLRAEDLISAFASALSALDTEKTYQEIVDEAEHWSDSGADEDDMIYADDLIEDLVVALNDFAPPYGYFGSHLGDGADYGFWLYEGWREDFKGLTVSDLSEVPDDYTGEVLVINDHGNASLYVWPEQINIWSVV